MIQGASHLSKGEAKLLKDKALRDVFNLTGSGLHRLINHHKWDFSPKGANMVSSEDTADTIGNY